MGRIVALLAGVARRVNSVAGMGYVFTSHEIRARLLRPFVSVLLALALSGRRSRLILQNKDDCEAFINAKLIPANRVHLIPGSGVDSAHFKPPSKSCVQQERVRVLCATRLLWDKGVKEFVDAARLLRAEGVSVDFLLAGSPDPGIEHRYRRAWFRCGVRRDR